MVDARYIVRFITAVGVSCLVILFGDGADIGAAVGQGAPEANDEADSSEAAVNPGAETATPDSATGEDADTEGEKKEGAEEESKPVLPAGADDEFAGQLETYREVYERYSREISDYQGTVDSIVDAEFKKRRSRINAKFDRRSEQLQSVERERRENAIEKFHAFLEKYPNHPTYTPDAMFRLAELVFEKENVEYMSADEQYQTEMQRYRAGRRPSPPDAPTRDYSETISVFSDLIEDWPDYRLLDGAYYLLAYCEQEMGNPRKARDLFAELIVKRPESEFVPEAWVRIGEYHFDRSDNPEEIELARGAYEQAMKYEQSRFFDKALYKLAWAYYRLDNFDEAITQFKRLVEYSDRQKEKTGESGSVLRAEAIKYIAVSLAEEDWNLDRSMDDDFGMPRIRKYLDSGEPYEREVLVELVDYLFENTRYEIATNVIRHTLKQYPKHPANPKLHEKLIVALTRPPRKPDEAFDERSRLVEKYGPESDWHAHQKREGNEKAVEYGDNLIRKNLIQAATWYHEQAQKLKDEARVKQDKEMLEKARNRYAEAADAYKRFLKRYPDDKDVYRWNFYFADSLYYSGQYDKAYEQYRVVRELDVEDNKFQADAAFNAVKSLEFQMKSKIESGELPDFIVPGDSRESARDTAREQQKREEEQASNESEESSDEKKLESKAIPDLVNQYITAMDRFIVLGLDYKQNQSVDAKFAFNAAKLFYDFNQFEPARKRFEWIVDNFPDREEAFLAGSLLLETYRREGKYDKLAQWADRLSGVLKGEQAKAVKEEVREFKLGAKFKSAEQLFNNEKYEKAAEKYIELVDEAPDHENAPRALNNAAVAYEEIKKYASAMELYQRVYREYPKSPLSGYALYRVAVNSERFFEFENAAETYTLFYDKYAGRSPEELEKMGFQISEKRPKALLSSAVLSENLQRYRRAAELYEKFVRNYPENDEAANSQWQAVEAWKKADESEKMIAAFKTYKEKFGDAAENTDRVLEGMTWLAEYEESQGRDKKAADKYREIIKTFGERDVEKGSDSAYYAAKAQFNLAERDFQDWKKIKIDGSLSQQKEKLQKKIEKQKEVSKKFKDVWDYKNLEYTLASSFRLGSLFQYFAESLYDVPIPFEPGSEQYMMYRTKLEDIAIPLEDKAIERYEKTIKKAREEKIVNQWTKKTLNELNKYRPNEYPLYKESRTASQKNNMTGRSLLTETPTTKDASEQFDSDSGPAGGNESDESSQSDEGQSDENGPAESSGDNGSAESSDDESKENQADEEATS